METMKDKLQSIRNWQASINADLPERTRELRVLNRWMEKMDNPQEEEEAKSKMDGYGSAAGWYESNLGRCTAMTSSVMNTARKACLASVLAGDKQGTISMCNTSVPVRFVTRSAVAMRELFRWNPGNGMVSEGWAEMGSIGYYAIHAASYLSLQSRFGTDDSTAGLKDLEDFARRFQERVDDWASDSTQYVLVDYELTYFLDSIPGFTCSRNRGMSSVEALKLDLGSDVIGHEPVPVTRMFDERGYVIPTGFLVRQDVLENFLAKMTGSEVTIG